MILRRLTKHVKEQNWFAVALDFVIVVVGVFIGIQVSNWNAARSDQARSLQYLERISADLSQDISTYDNRVQFWQQVSDYGLTVLDEADAGGTSLGSWDLLLAYFQASQVAEFEPSNSTFEELKSAGELGLVRDAKLRSELAQYYTYSGIESLRERPRYREHVRSIIPARMQLYIWSDCYQTDGSMQTLKACPSPAGQPEIQVVIDRLQSSEALHEELRYWISSLKVAGLIVTDHTQNARDLQAALTAQIALQRGDAQ